MLAPDIGKPVADSSGNMPNDIAKRDGTVSLGGGVNSIARTTLASPTSPDGLQRNQNAWLINSTCRDGGITPRGGWLRIARIAGPEGLFQGKFVYRPVGAFPYELWSVSGEILKVDLDTGAVVNLSQQFGLFNNPTEPFAYFVQAEEFVVIQSGDGVTLPLFYDGVTLRRSNGITGNIGQPGAVVYTFTTTNFFVVPSVGNTVTLTMAIFPPGLTNGTVGVLKAVGGQFDIGTFLVSGVVAGGFDITTVSSDRIGNNFPPFQYQFTDNAAVTPVLINEIPAATAMVYYEFRIWYAQDRLVAAGDIVFGPSGTAAYGFRDSVLKVTENPLAIGGDGFLVPSQDGNIRALAYGANINVANGQGRLFIFTIKAVYSLDVPISRDAWIAAGENNQPLMAVVQLANGSVNDRSVTAANGDLFYASLEPGIRSLNQADRLFQQWANISLSANVQRILQFNDRAIMRGISGIFFFNRLLMCALPRQTPQGIVHDAVIPLDVLPISTFDEQVRPNWEGNWQSMATFQMATADFGGRERAFAAVQSSDGSMELWEISTLEKFDYAGELSNESRRIQWQVETPAWTWATTWGEQELKKLVAFEMWVDRLFGTVEFELEYRPDGAACWIPWMKWKECNPKNTAEISSVPPGYPVPFGECYRATMVGPKPPEDCAPCGIGRPAYMCYQAQARLTIRGFCSLRGFWLWAERVERALYEQKSMVC